MPKNHRALLPSVGLALATLATPTLAQEPPSQKEMWQILQEQREQIRVLQERLDQTTQKVETTEKKIEATEERVEATGAMVEKVRETRSDTPGWWQRTRVGAYGELHYNGGKQDEIDLHRFVMFLNHDFTNRIRFFSEMEIEHGVAGEGQNGEVELEQAYLQFDLGDHHRANLGLQLIPVGILNETHEPTTFFGVERNPIETNILPTTWWEAGAGLNGEIQEGIGYDVLFHSGLATPTTGANAFKIRNGRQKVSEAPAKDGAVTGRLRWTGLPGVEIGVTGQYQMNVTQDVSDTDATLFEAHTNLRQGPWGLRALYARWDLNGPEPEVLGRDVQQGWYIEPSYRFRMRIGEVGIFARYNEWDNNAGSSLDTKFQQIDVGMNYWPHENVVIKMDFQVQDSPAGQTEDDRVNLGLGYQF